MLLGCEQDGLYQFTYHLPKKTSVPMLGRYWYPEMDRSCNTDYARVLGEDPMIALGNTSSCKVIVRKSSLASLSFADSCSLPQLHVRRLLALFFVAVVGTCGWRANRSPVASASHPHPRRIYMLTTALLWPGFGVIVGRGVATPDGQPLRRGASATVPVVELQV